jgi:hypothetical protein
MAQAALSWFWDFCLRALPGPMISDDAFEEKVHQKITFLKPLSVVRLCAEAQVLEDHLEHTPLAIPPLPDLVTLVAITRFLFDVHHIHDLRDYAEVTGYQPCCHLYSRRSGKENPSDGPRCWPRKVLDIVQAQVVQTLNENPKSFLIAWQPCEVILHQVCTQALETAPASLLMTLYDWLLTRLADLFSGKASVTEGDHNPQDLWQSIADTQEMLDCVQVLFLKNPSIPVDYCDYLKSHNVFEKKEFFTSRQDIFRSLMKKA